MIQIITVFIRQYLVSFFGAFTRFTIDRISKKSPRKTFKEYRDYSKNRPQDFIDAIIGTIVLMLIIALIIPFIRKL